MLLRTAVMGRMEKAMCKAVPSMAISMIREIVFGVGFALLLPRFFGLVGVLYSMPVSDILTFIIAAIVCARIYKELSCKPAGSKQVSDLQAQAVSK